MPWANTSANTLTAWAQLSRMTRPDYRIGVDFQIEANEQHPMLAVEDRPLIIMESGYSSI